VADRQRERLVGQDVRHDGALRAWPVGEVGRQRRGVEDVPRVEERREDDDPDPREAARDVPDGGELRGAREDDDAHRARLERREAGRSGGEAVDEPEAGRACDDA
jgi:hypothetical protein